MRPAKGPRPEAVQAIIARCAEWIEEQEAAAVATTSPRPSPVGEGEKEKEKS